MTPEQRAAQFSWKRCPGGEDHDAGEDGFAYACAKCNADEFREAEDEALERAAQVAEAGATWQTGHGIGKRLRSLKHKKGT